MERKAFFVVNSVLTVVLSVLIVDQSFNHYQEVHAQRDYSSEYKFTNPILDYENISMEEFALSTRKVREIWSELSKKYGLSYASVYFRDLDNGQWIGVNEKEKFAAASLIKLPVLIAFLKESESEHDLLGKSVTATQEDVDTAYPQDILPEHPVKAGDTLTLLEVAKRMIQESDNVAMKVLVRNIEEKYWKEIFKAVGVDFEVYNSDVLVRVKDYAGFFRVLFNASYLTRENSELALEILSHSSFDKGLVAGLPEDLLISHKFGERSYYIDDELSTKQLHDCGIIYYPQKPYILCVMTRGKDFENQEKFIAEVSHFFFDQLEESLRDN